MAGRTLEQVERDLRRAQRALKRLRRDFAKITRDIVKKGGVIQTPDKPDKVAPALRQMREVGKAVKQFVEIIKGLEAEKAAMTIKVLEATDEYTL